MACLCAGFLFSRPADAQPTSVADEDFWTTDGPVYAAVETNGVVYIGGAFTQVGSLTGSFVPLNPDTGKVSPPFARVMGWTSTVLADGHGGWFIAGDFNRVGALQRTNLVHLLADGTVDSFWQGAPNAVPRTLALSGNTLLMGGEFTAVNGQPRRHFACIDASTGQLLPIDVAVSAPVLAIAVSGKHAYIGGNFMSVAGADRSRLAKIDLTTGTLETWSPVVADALYDTGIFLLKVFGNRLYVGGDFTRIDGVPRNGAAAYDLVNETLLPWRPTPSSFGGVRDLVVMSNAVFIAGSFVQMNAHPRVALAAVDLENGDTLPWTANVVSGAAHAITATNGTVYVGGDFTGLATGGPARLAAIDSVTGAATAWNPAPGGRIRTIAVADNRVWVGGDFSLIGGLSRGGLAAIDLHGKQATAWNPGIGGVEGGSRVHALAISGDSLFVGGFLHSVGGQSRSGLAAVRLSDGSPLPFNARVGMPSGQPTIHKLAASGTNLFVRGRFEFIGGGTTADFAVVDTTTGTDTGWDSEVLGGTGGLALSETTLYVSGAFSSVHGQPRNNVAAFDLVTRQLTPWQPRIGSVSHLWLGGDLVYLAGTFTSVNGLARTNYAAVDAVTGETAAWSLVANGIPTSTAAGNAIHLAGTFQLVNNESRAGLGSVDALGGSTRAWNPGSVPSKSWNAATVQAILPMPGVLLLGGTFDAQSAGVTGTRFFPVTNRPPELTLASPSPHQVVHLPTDVTLEVAVRDPDGAVARVDYYIDRTLWASRTGPPFQAAWPPARIGTYLVSAVAYDNLGEPSVSRSARVVALPPVNDRPPTIRLAHPTNGETVSASGNVTIMAEVLDADSSIARVEFFRGTNLFLIDTAFPYTATLTNLPSGDYSIDAKVVDQFGVSATNGPVSFHINSLPTVSLSAPANNTQFPVGTGILLSATAGDSDGSVRRVFFLDNSMLVATVTNRPFQFIATYLGVGSHDIRAMAVDDFGEVAESGVVKVRVYQPPPNDDFAQRARLLFSVNRVLGSNMDASAEMGEPNHVPGFSARKTLWWTWTAPFSGRAMASTRGSTFDTLLGVFVGESLTTLTRVGGNNNESPQVTSSRVEFQAGAGTNYHFGVDGFLGQTGLVVLSVGPAVNLRTTNNFTANLPLHVTGVTNVTYLLQHSTNFLQWHDVQTNVPQTTPFLFVEPRPVDVHPHYYRILLEP